jgi:hypothetical protein
MLVLEAHADRRMQTTPFFAVKRLLVSTVAIVLQRRADLVMDGCALRAFDDGRQGFVRHLLLISH